MSNPASLLTPTRAEDVEASVTRKANTPGGLAMDIVLSPALKPGQKPVAQTCSPSPAPLEDRMVAAESRRVALDNLKAANLSEKLAKVEAAKTKKEELVTEKSTKTRDEMEAKLEKTEENRSAALKGTKGKMAEHLARVEKAQKELEIQTEAARLAAEFALNAKMMKAEEKKDEQMEQMLKKIKEHQEQVAEVRLNQDTRLAPYFAELEVNIKEKLSVAEKRRSEVIGKVVEAAKEEERKVEIVRQNKAKLQEAASVPESA